MSLMPPNSRSPQPPPLENLIEICNLNVQTVNLSQPPVAVAQRRVVRR